MVDTSFSSRTDWVTARLRNAILLGEVAPGEQLRANELAERFDVSPTPLREAFQRLARDGFLVQSTQRGVRVAPVSLEEMDELYELRMMLEPLALERSIEQADDSWTERVHNAWDQLDAALREEPADFVSYEDIHRAFHLALISNAGSSWLLRVVRQLRDHSERYRALSWELRGGVRAVRREHRELFEAAVHHEVERAIVLLRLHISRTQQAVRRKLDQRPPD